MLLISNNIFDINDSSILLFVLRPSGKMPAQGVRDGTPCSIHDSISWPLLGESHVPVKADHDGYYHCNMSLTYASGLIMPCDAHRAGDEIHIVAGRLLNLVLLRYWVVIGMESTVLPSSKSSKDVLTFESGVRTGFRA